MRSVGARPTLALPVLVSDLPPWFYRLLAFLFGAFWGSFFNVAIYRWPREMSVLRPARSHCPHCGAQIEAWRNLPIVGWLLLRGRTACCDEKLTPRYLIVEVLGAVLSLAIVERLLVRAPYTAELAPLAFTAVCEFAFVGGLLIATFVDLEWMEIPDEVSIGGTAAALVTVPFRVVGPTAQAAALGAGGAFLGIQLVLVWAWEQLTGRRGMGEGDAKLLMLIGAFLGWRGALFALVAGAFQGTVAVVVGMAAGRSLRPAPEEADEGAEDDGSTEAEEAELLLRDGTKAVVDGPRENLSVLDEHGRLLWEWRTAAEDAAAARTLPFGPFLALAALEFLFFGDRLIDAYLSLFA
jgi:leader peptidase (prepilin peptidase)/N-methyltransferase